MQRTTKQEGLLPAEIENKVPLSGQHKREPSSKASKARHSQSCRIRPTCISPPPGCSFPSPLSSSRRNSAGTPWRSPREGQGLAADSGAVGRGGACGRRGPGAHLPRRVLARPGEATQAVRCLHSPPADLTDRGVCPALAGASESPISSPPEASETEQRLGASIWKRSPDAKPIAARAREAPWDAVSSPEPPPPGRGPRESKKLVCPYPPGTRSRTGEMHELTVWLFNVTLPKLHNVCKTKISLSSKCK